jgi:hypothetical protein
MLISRKEIVAAVGLACILWSYYQLFAVDVEKDMLGRMVTAATVKGEVYGRAIAVRNRIVFIAIDKVVREVPEISLIEIERTPVDSYETRRAVTAVAISMGGGILVWIALFFL